MNTEDPAMFYSASIKPLLLHLLYQHAYATLRTWLSLRTRRGLIAENQCEKTRERESSGQEENAILHHDLLVA